MATRNRAAKLARTLAALRNQREDAYEIVVVDDGSDPPVSPPPPGKPSVKVLRTQGAGRSAARNRGARHASAETLVFVDDDILVGPDFLSCHLRAHREWREALATGAIRLPPDALNAPFASFRQRLEDQGMPQGRGPVQAPNFCAAGNMSIQRDRFLALGGLDEQISSGEDQDLALRHRARGGQTVYLPEARGIHDDDALDIRSYCRRVEWGARELIPFLHRHPELPENQRRFEVNGPLDWSRDSPALLLRKFAKLALARRTALAALFAWAGWLERTAPASARLPRLYGILLGIHIQLGFREGLKLYGHSGGAGSPVAKPGQWVS